MHITDFKESEHNIYGNNRNRKQEQNFHSYGEPKQKNQGTNNDDPKHCKEHNGTLLSNTHGTSNHNETGNNSNHIGTFLSNTHGTSNHNKMGNNSNHIRNSNTRDMVKMASAIVQGWHSVVSMENLSRMWNIGLETVQQMLWVTTQHGVRSAIHPLNRRYRVNHLHFHHCRLNSTFYTDGLRSKVTSLRGNLHAQVYTNGEFTVVYPMRYLGSRNYDIELTRNCILAGSDNHR